MSPIYDVKKIPIQKIGANFYKINYLDQEKYNLLKLSILKDGFTSALICFYDKKSDKYEIVDGFYRYKVAIENKEILQKEEWCLPVVLLKKDDLKFYLFSHIRHNKIKSEIFLEALIKVLKDFSFIEQKEWLQECGFKEDELLRLKQLSGLREFFKDKDFSKTLIEA